MRNFLTVLTFLLLVGQVGAQHKPLPVADTVGQDTIEYNSLRTIVDTPPEFVGGLQAYYNFLAKNLKYPVSARRMGIEGTVLVECIVERDGSITNAAILKGISRDCDKEILRLMSIMPNWKPATVQGQPVRMKHSLTIKFKLD